MKLGDSQEDQSWTYQGKRGVGPYVRDVNGWRRMGASDLGMALAVYLDREYEAIMKPRPSIWESFGR